MTDNPYKAPSVEAQPTGVQPGYMRFYNLNHAGVPLALAFVILPLALFGIGFLKATGRLVTQHGEPSQEGAMFLAIVLGVGELVALIYACYVPVLWFEIGPTLRYRSLLRSNDVDWRDVKRIWFDAEQQVRRIGAFIIFYGRIYRYLNIRLDDYKDLQVLVSAEREAALRSILQTHRNYRDSPFDEDEPAGEEDVD
ncbi:MAG: hypothetical protein SFU86_15565 [Pirellulaceae bacterium]|nr:hypothetical protein [Pirellulaceae bacterium]